MSRGKWCRNTAIATPSLDIRQGDPTVGKGMKGDKSRSQEVLGIGLKYIHFWFRPQGPLPVGSRARGCVTRFPVRLGPGPCPFRSVYRPPAPAPAATSARAPTLCWPCPPGVVSPGAASPSAASPGAASPGAASPAPDHARGRALAHLPEDVHRQPPGHVRGVPSGAQVLPARPDNT
uniref:Uncharacterized protein n=1 Tax=Pipistrellus kuhlii TaxID=59472 RepID=A0A7J7ZGA1_PIPKU|nr:hypothetical protein mPipKuh1_001663 [Pipistrellus kuhlii]